MAIRFLAVVVVSILGLTGFAHSQTPAERLSAHFLHGWTTAEQETAAKAIRKLEGQRGIELPRKKSNRYWLFHWTDYHGYMVLKERRARILIKMEDGNVVYPLFWPPMAPFLLRSRTMTFRPHIGPTVYWSIYQFSLPEQTLTGFAVSRDQNCRYEDQDIGDDELAKAYCADANARAVALFNKSFEGAKAIYPGGKTW